jgi:hypothetical protein
MRAKVLLPVQLKFKWPCMYQVYRNKISKKLELLRFHLITVNAAIFMGNIKNKCWYAITKQELLYSVVWNAN